MSRPVQTHDIAASTDPPLHGSLTVRESVAVAFSMLRLWPHLLVMLVYRDRVVGDLQRWIHVLMPTERSLTLAFVRLMHGERAFRSLFYYRVRPWGRLLRWLAKPEASLYFDVGSIGPGCYIQHGFATIVSAKSLGANCWINQQVTVGTLHRGGSPVLEDNVTVCCGAKVLGDVVVGRNSVIGANAVVVKSVPPDCVVAGVPARIIRRNGVRVDEPLGEPVAAEQP
jgi:serine O-acetyltransferase